MKSPALIPKQRDPFRHVRSAGDRHPQAPAIAREDGSTNLQKSVTSSVPHFKHVKLLIIVPYVHDNLGDGGVELLERSVACYVMQHERGGEYDGTPFDRDTQRVKNNDVHYEPMKRAGLHHHLQIVPFAPTRFVTDPPADMDDAGQSTQ